MNQIFSTSRGLKELPAKLGKDLTLDERLYVLNAFVHRFTKDHQPGWALKEWKDGLPYPVQYQSDAEWLTLTWFAVNADGSLNRKIGSCYAGTPTWPDNPELRK